MFRYAVETERRFYLANDVELNVSGDAAKPVIEVELSDAWVWDMYRKTRFVPKVQGADVQGRQRRRAAVDRAVAPSLANQASRGRWGEDLVALVGTWPTVTKWSTATGDLPTASSTSWRARALSMVFCEIKTRALEPVRPTGGRRRADQAAPATAAGGGMARDTRSPRIGSLRRRRNHRRANRGATRQPSSGRRRGGGPNRPCANGDEALARRRARRHSGRCRRESVGGTLDRHRPSWPRMAALAALRPCQSRRPTSPSSPEKRPRQQSDDGKTAATTNT